MDWRNSKDICMHTVVNNITYFKCCLFSDNKHITFSPFHIVYSSFYNSLTNLFSLKASNDFSSSYITLVCLSDTFTSMQVGVAH